MTADSNKPWWLDRGVIQDATTTNTHTAPDWVKAALAARELQSTTTHPAPSWVIQTNAASNKARTLTVNVLSAYATDEMFDSYNSAIKDNDAKISRESYNKLYTPFFAFLDKIEGLISDKAKAIKVNNFMDLLTYVEDKNKKRFLDICKEIENFVKESIAKGICGKEFSYGYQAFALKHLKRKLSHPNHLATENPYRSTGGGFI